MTDEPPLDLDKHRGMAAQKATDLRRALAEVENNAKTLRDRQGLAIARHADAQIGASQIEWRRIGKRCGTDRKKQNGK